MISIIERLRGFKSAAAQVWAHEAADLIEQQAERIKELEAKVQVMAREHVEFVLGAHSIVCTERDELKQTLAALHQRIAAAPVVAWVIRNAECDMKGWIPAKAWAEGEFQYPLISEEDLL